MIFFLAKPGSNIFSNMLIFLYGRDTYRSKENLDKIVAEYHRKYSSGLNFHVFDFDEAKTQDFENSFKSYSFFDEKKLILVKNSFEDSAVKKTIDQYNLTQSKDIIVIFYEKFSEEELKKKDKELLDILLKHSRPQKEFKPLARPQLKKWIINYLGNFDLSIKPLALEMLSENGSDLISQSADIDKLIGFAKSQGMSQITEKEVNLMIFDSRNINIFELLDSISDKQKAKAMFMIESFLKKGGDPGYLFSMVAYQIRNLLIVKDLTSRPLAPGVAVKKSGLHPFVYKKAFSACKKIDRQSLINWHSKLLDWDLKVKKGLTDIESVLLNMPLTFS